MNDQATVCFYSFRSLPALGHRSLFIGYPLLGSESLRLDHSCSPCIDNLDDRQEPNMTLTFLLLLFYANQRYQDLGYQHLQPRILYQETLHLQNKLDRAWGRMIMLQLATKVGLFLGLHPSIECLGIESTHVLGVNGCWASFCRQ